MNITYNFTKENDVCFSEKAKTYFGSVDPFSTPVKRKVKQYCPNAPKKNKTNFDKTYDALYALCRQNLSYFFNSTEILESNKQLFIQNNNETEENLKRRSELINKSLAKGYNKQIFERKKDEKNKKKYVYRVLNFDEE